MMNFFEDHKALRAILMLVFFVICMVLVVVGRIQTGPVNLCIMLVGLAGLILLLYLYNKPFTK